MVSEWVSVLVGGQDIRASVSEPDTSWMFPEIFVIMATSGANTPPHEVTGMLSREGDAAVAPALYHRLRSNPLSSSRGNDATPSMGAMGRPQATAPSCVWRTCTPRRRRISAGSNGTRRPTKRGRWQRHS